MELNSSLVCFFALFCHLVLVFGRFVLYGFFNSYFLLMFEENFKLLNSLYNELLFTL